MLVRRSGLTRGKLPPLRETGSVVGTGSPGGGRGARPRPTASRSSPAHRTCTPARSAAGTILDYETHLAISTTSWIGCCRSRSRRPTSSTRSRRSPASTPDRYLVANNHETGGACLQWLRDRSSPRRTPRPTSKRLTRTLAGQASAPGAGGVIFTPWLSGERSPVDDRNARGGFHNLSLATDSPDLVRAVLEGVAYNSRWLHDAVEKLREAAARPRSASSAAARSRRPLVPDPRRRAGPHDRARRRPGRREPARRRAARRARARRGARRTRSADLVAVDRVFAPDPAHRATYDRLYAEFPKLYKAQQDVPPAQRLTGSRHIVVTVCDSSGVLKLLCASKPSRS